MSDSHGNEERRRGQHDGADDTGTVRHVHDVSRTHAWATCSISPDDATATDLSEVGEQVLLGRNVNAEREPGELRSEDGARRPEATTSPQRGDELVRLAEHSRVAVVSARTCALTH